MHEPIQDQHDGITSASIMSVMNGIVTSIHHVRRAMIERDAVFRGIEVPRLMDMLLTGGLAITPEVMASAIDILMSAHVIKVGVWVSGPMGVMPATFDVVETNS